MRRLAPWSWTWGGFAALLAVAQLLQGDGAGLAWTVGAAALGWCVAAVVSPSRRALAVGLAAVLALLGVGSALEVVASARVWHLASDEGLVAVVGRWAGAPLRLAGGETGSRRWRAERHVNNVTLVLSARRVAGESGWQWDRSEEEIELARLRDDHGTFTRVTVPHGRDPYLLRSYDAGRPVAGTTFRVTLDLRADPPIAAAGCRGVRLQVWGPRGDASCHPVELGPVWTRFEHAWTAPSTAESHLLRLVINDFDGLSFDVRDVRLEALEDGAWRDVGPLLGAVPSVRIERGGDPVRQVPLSLGGQGATIPIDLLRLDASVGAELAAMVEVPRGVTIELGAARLGPDESWTPLPAPVRRSLWMGHPNLAGHAAATLGASLLAVGSGPVVLVVGVAGAAMTLVASASRAALWTFFLAAIAIAWTRRRSRAVRVVAGLVVAAGIVGLALAPPSLARLTALDGQGSASRVVIWRAALDAWGDAPWLGESDRWPEALEDAGASEREAAHISHAHNLWLEFARQDGLVGLLAVSWLIAGLVRIGWRAARSVGASLVGTVLVLQVADATLFYGWVLVPLLASLRALEATGDV